MYTKFTTESHTTSTMQQKTGTCMCIHAYVGDIIYVQCNCKFFDTFITKHITRSTCTDTCNIFDIVHTLYMYMYYNILM